MPTKSLTDNEEAFSQFFYPATIEYERMLIRLLSPRSTNPRQNAESAMKSIKIRRIVIISTITPAIFEIFFKKQHHDIVVSVLESYKICYQSNYNSFNPLYAGCLSPPKTAVYNRFVNMCTYFHGSSLHKCIFTDCSTNESLHILFEAQKQLRSKGMRDHLEVEIQALGSSINPFPP